MTTSFTLSMQPDGDALFDLYQVLELVVSSTVFVFIGDCCQACRVWFLAGDFSARSETFDVF